MEDTAKYLIHADLVVDGIVERSDVVGAAFGQTEGLLGDDLDIRDLQESAKLGRIDVSIDSEGGQSFGHVTIASSMDRVETATLAASLEAVERIGPCRADVEVQRIEDVRAAKRREVVDRAKELLATAFDEGAMDSEDILQEVRESVRVEDVTDYEGYPAGPNVETSDAVIVVEGRADVLTLLGYGIKNVVAVEGTNVPDEIAALTQQKNVTAFLDGDRGGDLIRRELQQVAAVDYVARAPRGESVEDLSRQAVDAALREKTPASAAGPIAEESATETDDAPEQPAATGPPATDGSATPAPTTTADSSQSTEPQTTDPRAPEPQTGSTPQAADSTADAGTDDPPAAESAADSATESAAESAAESAPRDQAATEPAADAVPQSLADHVDAVAGDGTTRLLDSTLDVLAEAPAADAFDVLEDAEDAPTTVVVDAPVTQRLLDLAAQRGVATLVGTDTGEFVKQPVGVTVRSFDDF